MLASRPVARARAGRRPSAARAYGVRCVAAAGAPPASLPLQTVRDLRGAKARIPSPFYADGGFVDENDRVSLFAVEYASPFSAGNAGPPHSLRVDRGDRAYLPIEGHAVRAGPSKDVWYDAPLARAAIVTCGGLCPGINDVVRSVYRTLRAYGVPQGSVFGIQYGLRGLTPKGLGSNPPIELTDEHVTHIHTRGGTVLGTSRGGANVPAIVDGIEELGLDMLFVVGGNGGNKAASVIATELLDRGVACSIIALPKTIDNDILILDKCFGFDTSVEEAVRAVASAWTEATSARHGVGVVKLMGRQSGHIALATSLASGLADICLIPEVPVVLEGSGGVLEHLEHVLRTKGHAVIVVAEGACQEELGSSGELDLSGNPVLVDVGPYLVHAIKAYFKRRADEEVTRATSLPPIKPDVKYIAPSYLIRSLVANASDKILCTSLGANAVHAAFTGYTAATVGVVNTHFCVLPSRVLTQAPATVDPRARPFNRLCALLRQPRHWGDATEAAGPGTPNGLAEAPGGTAV